MTSADVTVGADGVTRCWWCGDDPLYVDYHDREWGTPLRDERALFELLCLEGFQAGLSWITILRKREAFREAFEGFDPEVVARYDERDVERLLANPGIVRHRGKITATIANARALSARCGTAGTSLEQVVWSHAPAAAAAPLAIAPRSPPRRRSRPRSPRALRKWGMRFVGATTVYAFMQSAGLVDDHLAGLPSSGRRQRSPPPSRSLSQASDRRRARSAAAAKAAASPPVPAASPITCTSGWGGGRARRCRGRRARSVAASGAAVADRDAGPLGRGHQAEAARQPELGRQHRRRRGRASTSCPSSAGVQRERHGRLAAPVDDDRVRRAAAPSRSHARRSSTPRCRRRATARPTAHTSTSASGGSMTGEPRWIVDAGVLGRADQPVEQPGEVGVGAPRRGRAVRRGGRSPRAARRGGRARRAGARTRGPPGRRPPRRPAAARRRPAVAARPRGPRRGSPRTAPAR